MSFIYNCDSDITLFVNFDETPQITGETTCDIDPDVSAGTSGTILSDATVTIAGNFDESGSTGSVTPITGTATMIAGIYGETVDLDGDSQKIVGVATTDIDLGFSGSLMIPGLDPTPFNFDGDIDTSQDLSDGGTSVEP